MTTENNLYKTSDTALASYLIASSFTLKGIDYSQPRFEFSFVMSPGIQDHASQYLIGAALTDPVVFNRINRKLLRIVRQQIQWEDD